MRAPLEKLGVFTNDRFTIVPRLPCVGVPTAELKRTAHQHSRPTEAEAEPCKAGVGLGRLPKPIEQEGPQKQRCSKKKRLDPLHKVAPNSVFSLDASL